MRKAIFQEISHERDRQDTQFGGAAHDDRHVPTDWRSYRSKYEERINGFTLAGDARDALVKIAALAVAQIESIDRMVADQSYPTNPPPGLVAFRHYFLKNYPPDCVIHDPWWHVDRLYRAATRGGG